MIGAVRNEKHNRSSEDYDITTEKYIRGSEGDNITTEKYSRGVAEYACEY